MSESALASFVVFIYNRDELQFTRIHEETTIHSKGKERNMHCNTVVNGQKEKPIFVGTGFIGDSEFLILRIETDCNSAKFTRKQSQERKFSPLVLQFLQCRKSGPVRSETGPKIVVSRSK